jgi:hypothetical protein
MKPSTNHRGVWIAVMILSSFLFFMFIVIFTYIMSGNAESIPAVFVPFVQYHLYFMIGMGALGVAVGASTFYFMSQKVEHTHVAAQKTGEIVLRFLSADERKVIKRLVEEHGKATQAELTRMEGLNKVKVHRILAKLAEKEIVILESYGKTNAVRLKPEIYDALS